MLRSITRAREARSAATSLMTLLGVGATLFVLAAASEGTAQGARAESAIRDTVLANGLTVIAVRNPVIPVATIELAFRDGAFTQLAPADEGIPHLLEHMVFKSFRGGSWSARAADLNAPYNGVTDWESVRFYLIVPSSDVEKGIDLIAEQIQSPRFPEEDLLEERMRVQNEVERSAADPLFLLEFYTRGMLWGAAARQKNTLGNLSSVLTATPETIRAHYERFYVPNNAALIVTGEIAPVDVFTMASEHFRSWDRERDPFDDFLPAPVPTLARDSLVVLRTNIPDVLFSIAWQGPSVSGDLDGVRAAQFFSEIVTQPISGAQYRLLDSGLFDVVSFFYRASNAAGPIRLIARTDPERAVAAARALREEIVRMGLDDYFTDEELRLAKRRHAVADVFQRESGISTAHRLAHLWATGRSDLFATETDQSTPVSASEIRQFVSRYITGRPRALIMAVAPHTINAHSETLVEALNAWVGQ